MSDRRQINAMVAALIDGQRLDLDAAAELINARTGGAVCKGTLSKRLSGQLGWPVEDVVALEDAAGRYPVTRMLARRMDARRPTAAGSIYAASGAVAKETGEAIQATMAAAQSMEAGDLIAALKESLEGHEACGRMVEAIEAALAERQAS